MPEGEKGEDPKLQAEAASKAFEQEFERFARFRPVSELSGQDSGEVSVETKLKETESYLRELTEVRSRHTGKKSALASVKKMIGRVAPEERAGFGQLVQQIEARIISEIDEVEASLKVAIAELRIDSERIDVTLPGRRPRRGHLHPITLLRQKIEDIFVSLGYAIEDDREIETDFYNFTALNIPDGHPARDPLDTFYTTAGFALRSQTSTVQIHAMQRRNAPLRMIAPGRVFRRDTPDATHNPMFYQVEGLCVDRGITMEHLKGTLTEMIHRLVGPETRTRFRPSYFPFTEPSAEVDYSCFKCNGAGCRICKQSGWIELGGSGMVHPNVLQTVGIDPEEFSGFAFGFGIDRMSALMYKLDDIRLLFENDVRFLEQFN
ncbi:MAG: phenylalanyl-tRNA synthetase alpha chain [Acidobacteriota bacterium]|jgi:phenylalanyl-tRNA synthetase alpha chain|nr:phenylalanyl-tRNA synthetase alpha chain [Acidobacteriota bacterium]